MQRQKY